MVNRIVKCPEVETDGVDTHALAEMYIDVDLVKLANCTIRLNIFPVVRHERREVRCDRLQIPAHDPVCVLASFSSENGVDGT